jgi:transposase
VGPIQHTFEWFYIYGAVAPTTGERLFLELPYLNADSFQLFVDALAQAFPDSFNLLLLDNSGAHTAQRIRWPAHVQSVWLPPYGPELNPIERVWRDVKVDLAWQQFVDLVARLRHPSPAASSRSIGCEHLLPHGPEPCPSPTG